MDNVIAALVPGNTPAVVSHCQQVTLGRTEGSVAVWRFCTPTNPGTLAEP